MNDFFEKTIEVASNPLAKILATGQISHAYLLIGEDSVAVPLAFWFARGLNCQARGDGAGDCPEGPCDKCPSCRKALHGNHSAIHHITAANGKQYISIEQIRNMQQQAYLSHLEGEYQIFLLAAQQLRTESANSLLKVLEEPPVQTVFLLYAEKDMDILPTVLSRCQVVRLQEKTVQMENELLMKASQWLADFPQLSADRLLSWGEKWDKDRQGVRAFLLAALQYCHNVILKTAREQQTEQLAALVGPWLEVAAVIEGTVESLDKNVNQRLLLDVMVLKLKKLLG